MQANSSRGEGKLRVGIVGLSEIAIGKLPEEHRGALRDPLMNSHAWGYSRSNDVDVIGICDVTAERFELFSLRWGKRLGEPRCFFSHEHMLSELDLDVLSVCTPDNLHAKIVCDAALSGVKGILCEKPLATTTDEARMMVQVCRDRQVLLSVNHKRRFRPAYQIAKDLIRKGEIGEVAAITARIGGPRAMLFRNGTHLIDGVCYFADSYPSWVTCDIEEEGVKATKYSGDGGRSPDGDPGGTGYVKFNNGVRATVSCLKRQAPGFKIEIDGGKGRLVVANEDAGSTVGSGTSVTMIKGGGIVRHITLPYFSSIGIAACIDELIEAVTYGGTLCSSGEEALKAVEIIGAFLISHGRSNSKVDIGAPRTV